MDSECPADNRVRMEKEYKNKQEPIYYLASLTSEEEARAKRFHVQEKGSNQARGFIYKEIEAPSDHVWKVIRRFDRPQAYKKFLVGCCLIRGDGGPGSIRRVWLQPELPGKYSIEQLELLDDENQVLSFRILGGEHKLKNYTSITSVANRTLTTGKLGSLVIESYVVDVPEGNTEHQTNVIVHTLIRTHLISLEKITRFEQRQSSQVAASSSDSTN
ncbi:hypothetical protein Mapa_003671 [Marchantia paleacea]|nr:hypothetical protein Mapa_003671 [Marchantia paleacea]